MSARLELQQKIYSVVTENCSSDSLGQIITQARTQEEAIQKAVTKTLEELKPILDSKEFDRAFTNTITAKNSIKLDTIEKIQERVALEWKDKIKLENLKRSQRILKKS